MTKFSEETNYIATNSAPFQDRMAEKLNAFIGSNDELSPLEPHIQNILIEARDYVERNYKAFVGLHRKGQELEYSLHRKTDELQRMDKVLDVVLAVANKTGSNY